MYPYKHNYIHNLYRCLGIYIYILYTHYYVSENVFNESVRLPFRFVYDFVFHPFFCFLVPHSELDI